jgi:hypothetical protein
MYVEIYLLNSVRNVEPSERQEPKGANETPKLCGICHNRARADGDIGLKFHNNGEGLPVCHPRALKNVLHVVALMQEEPSIMVPLRCQGSSEEILGPSWQIPAKEPTWCDAETWCWKL